MGREPTSLINSLQQYSSLEAVGQGSAGVVYAATRKDSGQRVALKVIRTPDEELIATARGEFELLRNLRHPNIVRAFDFFTVPIGAVMVMELFVGSSLNTAVSAASGGCFEERTAQPLFAALLSAVGHLHNSGIVHRDVKAPNILVSAELNDLRLVDFNTAQRVLDGALTMTGTADYMPPEVLMGDSLGESSDIWASGLCLHLMLSGELPLERCQFSTQAAFGAALSQKLKREAPLTGSRWAHLDLSAPCLEVLHACLETDAERRPGAATLLAAEWVADALPLCEAAACGQ